MENTNCSCNDHVQTNASPNCCAQNQAQNPVEKETFRLMPLVDILESADGVTMWFEIPGANSSSVKIEVKEKVMDIKAESTLVRNGRRVVFERGFQLADSIDVEHITAKTQDGVLTLNLPKSESAKVHRIQVC